MGKCNLGDGEEKNEMEIGTFGAITTPGESMNDFEDLQVRFHQTHILREISDLICAYVL